MDNIWGLSKEKWEQINKKAKTMEKEQELKATCNYYRKKYYDLLDTITKLKEENEKLKSLTHEDILIEDDKRD
jgi:hypothetical protein